MDELMLQLPSPVERDCLDWAAVLSAESAGVNLTFKLPCHKEWQHAHTGLRAAGYATLLTGVSNSAQLLWAQAQDAVYVAPYLGRLEAAGRDVMGFIAALAAVQHRGGPKVMAASVKTEGLLNALLAQGVYACTVKPSFLNDLVRDGVTQSAMVQFAKDCTLNDDTPK
jgi:transaldolase